MLSKWKILTTQLLLVGRLASELQIRQADTLIVEDIVFRTEHETLQKIYNLPQFSSTLEFLTMLALSSGRLLKVRVKSPVIFYIAFPTEFAAGWNA